MVDARLPSAAVIGYEPGALDGVATEARATKPVTSLVAWVWPLTKPVMVALKTGFAAP